MSDTTRRLRPQAIIARKRLHAHQYVVREVPTGEGGFRNLYDITNGTDVHVASLQMSADHVPGGLTVYRDSLPSVLVVWLIGLPKS